MTLMANQLSYKNKFGAFTVASRGASLLALTLNSLEVLHDFGDSASDWAAGAVMFPFPVRMETGTQMHYNNKSYHWPVNDTKHKAALHGFTPWVDFDLTTIEAGIKAAYEYEGVHPYYPFPCKLTLQYTLGEDGFRMAATVENIGKNELPYHLGWHPYFKLASVSAISPSPMFRLEKNALSHPCSKVPCSDFDWNDEVDGAFYMSKVYIEHQNYLVEIKSLSQIIQLFRPKDAAFIAVEPITGLGHSQFEWRTVNPGASDGVFTTIKLC